MTEPLELAGTGSEAAFQRADPRCSGGRTSGRHPPRRGDRRRHRHRRLPPPAWRGRRLQGLPAIRPAFRGPGPEPIHRSPADDRPGGRGMTLLLHTNVVSELRKPKPDRNVLAWYATVRSADLFLSVLTI